MSARRPRRLGRIRRLPARGDAVQHGHTRFYSDAPGLAILAAANRAYGWTPEHAETVLLWMLVAAVAVVAAVVLLRGPRLALAIAVAAAVLTLGWNVTGEVNAARGSTAFADQLMANLPQPPTWVDQRDGRRADALYRPEDRRRERPLAARVLEPLDPAGLEPGRLRARARDRRSRPTCSARRASSHGDPGYRYAVAETSIELAGKVLRTQGGWRLYEIDPPLRLASSTRGIFADGWIGSNTDDNRVSAGYSRFVDPNPAAGRCSSPSAGRRGAATRTSPAT